MTHLLIRGSSERSAETFDGVQAAVEPFHTLEDGSKLPHSNVFQLQELTLIAWQHEGLESLPLSNRWRDAIITIETWRLVEPHLK